MTETTTAQRASIVRVLDYMLARPGQVNYPADDVRTQVICRIATMPELMLAISRSGGMTIDCSQFVTVTFHVAGLNDPNRLGWAWDGDTATLLDAGWPRYTNAADALPGGLCVFGAYPGEHVAVCHTPGPDPLLASQGRPQDPSLRRLSDFAGEFTEHVWLSIQTLG